MLKVDSPIPIDVLRTVSQIKVVRVKVGNSVSHGAISVQEGYKFFYAWDSPVGMSSQPEFLGVLFCFEPGDATLKGIRFCVCSLLPHEPGIQIRYSAITVILVSRQNTSILGILAIKRFSWFGTWDLPSGTVEFGHACIND